MWVKRLIRGWPGHRIVESNRDKPAEFSGLNEEICVIPPKHRRDFCMLVLKLVQCPDLDYFELMEILNSGEYALLPEHVENFKHELRSVANRDVGSIMEAIVGTTRLMGIEPSNTGPMVHKSSPAAFFLRRVALFYNKLSFSQLVNACKEWQAYLQDGVLSEKPAWAIRRRADSSCYSSDRVERHQQMDLCSISKNDFSLSLELLPRQTKQIKMESESMSMDKPKATSSSGTWSRRQAELFIARQAALIHNDINTALPPAKLHQKINEILNANPNHVEAHYLSYLNYLRSKEFCGAMHSLRHYFDRMTMSMTQEEKNKSFRYSALNIAILHAQFNQKEAALDALKEAISLSHEEKDNICLQHAQAWLYNLTEENKSILLERSICKSGELNLNYLASLGFQFLSQLSASRGGRPAQVFEAIMRSDLLNCQLSMPDMFGKSLSLKAALWALYGKSEMASLASQLLLHLSHCDAVTSSTLHNADGTCQAICNVANFLIELGEYQLAVIVLDYARSLYPTSKWWQVVEQILFFTQALYKGQWQAAHTAVRQLSTLDKWESCVRLAELLLAKGDNQGVKDAVEELLNEEASVCHSLRVRAMLLISKTSPTPVFILTTALSIASFHFLHYLTALVIMEIAQVQLNMGLPAQALKLVDHSLLIILSQGGLYDQACALFLYVKCKVAWAASLSWDLDHKNKTNVITECLGVLETAKTNFRKVEAFNKVKESLHLQALLSNEIGCYKNRNRYSLEFRQIDEEYPTKSVPVPAHFASP
ncbi:anaphase-promoting complex subunit 5 isoform X2 [Nilaparvata lugens]|uniref:anaphase-promoting complex subunit 5 isoform X2 n=1 Tax=Nilaparvata lugens TaxID=108931 RepID=UPI00193EAB2A|nr:anaphase-promoting complex subunit 5 isoform X2 [Nilaparvata lugens]